MRKICQLILTISMYNNGKSNCICDIAWFFKSVRAVLLFLTLDKQKVITTLVSKSTNIQISCCCSLILISISSAYYWPEYKSAFCRRKRETVLKKSSKMANPTINKNVRNTNRQMVLQECLYPPKNAISLKVKRKSI